MKYLKDSFLIVVSVIFSANLFLCFYESKMMNKLKKNELKKAEKLSNISNFIDDLNSTNDTREFENNYSNIYPNYLYQLVKENTD